MHIDIFPALPISIGSLLCTWCVCPICVCVPYVCVSHISLLPTHTLSEHTVSKTQTFEMLLRKQFVPVSDSLSLSLSLALSLSRALTLSHSLRTNTQKHRPLRYFCASGLYLLLSSPACDTQPTLGCASRNCATCRPFALVDILKSQRYDHFL